jgi:hypothetical protein
MSYTPHITRFVVAIHGIGNQRRCETIRSAANQFADFINPGSPVQPLGHYNLGGDDRVVVSQVQGLDPMGDIGVAEVYWADLPRGLAQRGDTLDESKAWARTVAGRARRLYMEQVYQQSAAGLAAAQLHDVDDQKERDFKQASGVIEEIVEGVAVLENLMFLADKAGIAKFDLGALLADYIGGVQLVADFAFYRNEIIGRFHKALVAIVEQSASYCDRDELKIYLVAHSEGTVVTMAALLEALLFHTDRRREGASQADMSWIDHVRGLMTIGSPLDKHVLLWPNLWTDLGLVAPQDVAKGHPAMQDRFRIPPSKIRWCNYYDLGDPVAFDVQETRRYIQGLGCANAFDWVDESEATDFADYGFSRYVWPGYAHLGYWGDEKVFEHFIRNVAFSDRTELPSAPRPPSKWYVGLACFSICYVAPFLVQFLAVAVLIGTLNPFVTSGSGLSLAQCVVVTLGMGFQLSALCVAARLPRLGGRAARGFPTFCLSLAIFVLGSIIGTLSFCPPWIGEACAAHLHLACCVDPALGQRMAPVSGFWYLPPGVGLVAILMCWWPRWLPPERRAARAGRRILVIGVALLAVTMVTLAIFIVKPQSGHSYLAPTFGLLGFIYLWWIGVVLFDLAYIWNNYIRKSRVVKTLRTWMKGQEVVR